MLEKDAYCTDILVQVAAVNAALNSFNKVLLANHIRTCVAEDIHEGFCDAEGKPYEYIGHFAWIPMLNDDCRVDFDGSPVKIGDREVSLLEWLACQKE